jgi:hypothetical protein
VELRAVLYIPSRTGQLLNLRQLIETFFKLVFDFSNSGNSNASDPNLRQYTHAGCACNFTFVRKTLFSQQWVKLTAERLNLGTRPQTTQYKWRIRYALGLRAAEARVHERCPASKTNDPNVGSTPHDQTINEAQTRNDHTHSLMESRGNIGSPKRQQKHRRGKSKEDYAKSSGRQSAYTDDYHAADGAKYRAKKLQHKKLESRHATSESTKECNVCTETRPLFQFPERTPTEDCQHGIETCTHCLRTWIESDFKSKMWNEVNCPTCRARLQHNDVMDFAPRNVFVRYVSKMRDAYYIRVDTNILF